ncbi:MAG TPA: hypothetical protein VFQ45_10410 [Longimicrobium sp.]|nr:hypothetical protein [Longimicrobium sp.]
MLPLAWLLMAFSCEEPLTPEEEYAEAQRVVDWWVAMHPDGWDVDLSGWPLQRPEWSKPCSQNPPMGTVVLRYFATNTEIDLHFRCPLGASSTAQDLAAAFQFAVLTHLPHGLLSSGWKFEMLTPTSSISEGVTFPAPGPRQLLVDIDTRLYAVYGQSVRKACEPPQDAPALEGCYLSRQHSIPLRIRMSATFDAYELVY